LKDEFNDCNQEKPMPIPVVTLIGKSNSGKTTLLEKLIPALRQRGYRVGTVKHHSHTGFEIDQPGKDSWRYARAGSQHVVIAAPDKIASYRFTETEASLDEVLAEFRDVDIVLVEGYKRAEKPSIEILRAERSLELIGSEEQLIAVATDTPLEIDSQQFDLEDVQGIADLIEMTFLRK
jgi:molybdopterin-guanine dinucleotide biosynthesis adapter protein